MLKIRRAEDIYHVEGGWFSANWHFSFDQYRDPNWMGFGPLRVFNDDRLIPGAVWPMHPHRDIEGITYVVEGLFEHADSLGNGGYLEPGAIQRATLGSGMEHSERNGSKEKPMRFLQFWLLPHTANLKPSLEQRQYTKEDRTGRLLEVVNPTGENAVKVHQDARVYLSSLEPGQSAEHRLGDGRGAYVYLIEGEGTFDDQPVRTGDAATVEGQHLLKITATQPSELILIDVPMVWEPVGVWGAIVRAREKTMKIDVDGLPVRNNEAEGQFEIEVAGELPLLAYFVRGSVIYLVHTEVPESLEGHGLAAKLAQHALDYARANGLTVVPRCPYVRAYLRQHPEYADLVEAP